MLPPNKVTKKGCPELSTCGFPQYFRKFGEVFELASLKHKYLVNPNSQKFGESKGELKEQRNTERSGRSRKYFPNDSVNYNHNNWVAGFSQQILEISLECNEAQKD